MNPNKTARKHLRDKIRECETLSKYCNPEKIIELNIKIESYKAAILLLPRKKRIYPCNP
ncbi:MAG: hypothetical protein V4538_15745 [Bacteroidota bacterium]